MLNNRQDRNQVSKLLRLSQLLATTSLAAVGLPGMALAQAVPSGGTVAAGSAMIGGSGSAVTITQTSQRAVIDWGSFSVGNGATVNFVQPNSGSATLNRVTGVATSTIAGSITANGAVYLVNPNGITITSNGTVDTTGGFIGSTLGIADADFMAGKLAFAGNGASAKISNGGRISAGSGAYVALLGGAVANSGTISVPLGRVGLASGEQIELDINGSNFMQVAVPTAMVSGSDALVDVGGTIFAAGGRVTLSAATVKDAMRNVVNLSGTINADSASGDGGTIHLLGGEGGLVRASGTLSARALGSSGNGGTIETSGATVDYTGLIVDTRAAHGTTGHWLIDPTDLAVDAAAAATISANLASANVTLSTTGTSATGPGVQTAGLGDINVNSPITWSSANTLTLSAWNGINIGAAISASAGGLSLAAGTSGAPSAGTIGSSAAINVGLFNLSKGNWTQVSTSLPGFNATDFEFTPASATFLRVAGGVGTVASPYLITDVYGLQGVASQTLLAKNFALANAISATGTALWNSGKGWMPIGTDGVNVLSQFGNAGFRGSFDGRGFSITGLALNRPSVAYAGLFGYLGGSVTNLGVDNAQFSAGGVNAFGLLAGYLDGGSVTGSHSSGAIIGVGTAGGLVGGVQGGTVSDSWSSASVTATAGYNGSTAGGLIAGANSATVARVYATGAVSAVGTGGGLIGASSNGSVNQAWASGNVSVTGATGVNIVGGGLIGSNSGGVFTQSYATGSVVGTNAGFMRLGGLIGSMIGGSLATSYATGSVQGAVSFSGGIDAGGLSGAAQSATITESWASGNVSSGSAGFENAAGGLVGNLYSATLTGSYWDSYSTGLSQSVGTTLFSTISTSAVTSDPSQATAVNLAYRTSAYASFQPGNWSYFDGATRPFGSWELPTAVNGVTTLVNDHQLQLVAKALARNYVLGADIDLSATGAAQAGLPATYSGMWSAQGFVPIGDSTVNFTGSLDGQNRTVRNLTIKTTANLAGLFGAIGSGSVSNLSLAGFAITIDSSNTIIDASNPTSNFDNAGLLAGISLGTISQVRVSGAMTVRGNSNTFVNIGGLIGTSSGTVSGSSATGSVTASHGRATIGGLVGKNNGSIQGSFSQATVTGAGDSTDVGGLIGDNSGSISQSFATGILHVPRYAANAGGLAGKNFSGGTIANSYFNGGIVADQSMGAFSGVLSIGGLVGGNAGFVVNSYAVATMEQQGQFDFGLFIGGLGGIDFGGSFVSSYWDTSVSGQTNGESFGTPTGATGLSTASLQNFLTSGTQYSGWDFTGVWAPPAQAGQAGQSQAFYPTLYATSPVVFITPTNVSRIYGSSGAVGTVNGGPSLYRFGPTGDALAANSLFVNSVTAASPVGMYSYSPIAANSVTSAGGVTYRVISAGGQGSITITPAPLTLTYTANAATSTYGASLPALSGSVSGTGLVNGDTLAALSGSTNWSTTATPSSNVGAYAITGSGLSSGNYTITANQAASNASAYTITRAPLVVTYSANAASRAYGAANPALSGTVGSVGLVNGDTLTGTASFATTATTASNVGGYAINGSGLSASSNYATSFVQAAGNATALSINPATLVVTYTASAASRAYGAANPALSGTADSVGLVNGDTLTGTASFATTATTASNVGSYAINGLGLTASSNYSASFVQAGSNATALTINPATLVVTYTANATSRAYGAANPSLSGTVGSVGLVNGDALTGMANFDTTATTATNVGSYVINGSGLTASSNYSASFVQAGSNATALTINPATLVVTYTANAASRAYGAANPEVSGTVGSVGLVNGDTLTGTASFATTATTATDVGSYAINGSGQSASSNYAVSSVQAGGNASALTIVPRGLTLTADGLSRTYGAANLISDTATAAAGTATTGLVNGDTVNSIAVTSPAVATSPVGSYALIGSGAVFGNGLASNYAITYAANATGLSITPAHLKVTALGGSSTFGTSPANPGLSATGLQNGESVSVLTGLSNSFGITSTSNAGNYALNVIGTLTNANYFVDSRIAGNWTVNPAALTVITAGLIGNTSKVYNATTVASLTSANFLLSGFVGSDNATVNQTVGTYASANVGTGIAVTASLTPANFAAVGSTNLANYMLPTTASGNIGTITPATLTYLGNSASQTYGAANSVFSGSVTGFVSGQTQANATTGTLSFASPAIAASNVGTYAINGSGLTANNGNYIFVQAASNATALTINPATLVVTYTANAASRAYGAANPALSGTADSVGLVNGDTLAGTASFATTATTATNVGNFAINGSGLTASSNYTASFVQAAGNATALTINPATLVVTYTANAASRAYGAANPSLSGTVSSVGLVNDDTLTGTASFATTATPATNVGSYAINGSGQSASSNYAVSSVQASGNASALTITRAPLTLTYTANAATSTYGATLPALSGSVSGAGLVNGDTLAALSGSTNWTTTATPSSNVGAYAITGSGLSSSNYTITANQAASNATALTITRALLTLTYIANQTTLTYGQPLPALTGQVQAVGLQAADTLFTATTGRVMFTALGGSLSLPGTYAIQGSGLSPNANYTLISLQALANAKALIVITPEQTLNSFSALDSTAFNTNSLRSQQTRWTCSAEAVSRALRDVSSVAIGGPDCGAK